MGKNQSASNLVNIFKQDTDGSVSIMHDNTMLMRVSSSGAITTTGVISGSNALSASYAVSASLAASAVTASFVQNAQSASYVLTAQTASFVANAQSASNAIIAQTSSYANNLTVAGTLTAQTLVVQTITSSVDFVTGSTRFGSILDNTHVFTGSMNVTGSVTLNGALSGTSATFSSTVSGTSGNFNGNVRAVDNYNLYKTGNTTLGGQLSYDGAINQLYLWNSISNGFFSIYTNSTERLTITSGGNVGIGTSSPTTRLHVSGTTGGIFEVDGAAAVNALYVSASGLVGIGTTTPSFTLDVNGSGRFASPSTFGTSASNGDVTIISNGGPFQIKGRTTYDRTFLALSWDINPDVGVIIGNALKFNVSASWGTNTGTTALTILANGKVGIGETNPDNSYQGLTIKGSDPSLRIKTTSSSGWVWTEYVNSSGTNNFSMGVNQTTPYFGIKAGAGMDNVQFRMDSSGKIGMNHNPSTNPQLSIGGSLKVGRSIYGWFQSGTNSWDGLSFLHLKTNMSAGLGGNIDYTMSLFYARLYSYTGQIKEGHLGFHNWDGAFFATAATGNIWTSPYRSSDGFVVLVLTISSSSHVGVTVDWHQAFPYPFVDKIVTASSASNSSSGVY